ncbi:MAG: hypothetical protein HYT72_04435 [Candidatus Aenigmarchaeota archaeon]|nr:hypothetical protein [Candidatus Aenigmarchaeota archaeon]
MLTKTSDVLSFAGNSLAQLEQRLDDEIGDATLAAVLNQAVGEIFANASKCITTISTNGSSTIADMAREERGLLNTQHNDAVRQQLRRHAGVLSQAPKFIDERRNGGPSIFSKTLLGQMVGDLFAVQGVYAGADPELDDMASVFGNSVYAGGLSAPVISFLMVQMANTRPGFSLSRFMRQCGLVDNDGTAESYAFRRCGEAAHRLSERGFIDYRAKHPTEQNIYAAISKILPDNTSFYSREAAHAVLSALQQTPMTIRQTADTVNYSVSYTQQIISWLHKHGYLQIDQGMPTSKKSSVWRQRKAGVLWGYVDEPMRLLGASPKRNTLWNAPSIDVPGLVQYRTALIDPLSVEGPERRRFEEACGTAYQRHLASSAHYRKN